MNICDDAGRSASGRSGIRTRDIRATAISCSHLTTQRRRGRRTVAERETYRVEGDIERVAGSEVLDALCQGVVQTQGTGGTSRDKKEQFLALG